ncbi:MAG: hypothetical protein Q4A55_03440 [Aerococcus sp.]|nr:hypothetical protein [Aerococcus sp.]
MMDLREEIIKAVDDRGLNKLDLIQKAGLKASVGYNFFDNNKSKTPTVIKLAKALGIDTTRYDPKNIYDQLVALMNQKGYSPSKIAEESGVSEYTLDYILQGHYKNMHYRIALDFLKYFEKMDAKKELHKEEAPQPTIHRTTKEENLHLSQSLNLLRVLNEIIDDHVETGEVSDRAGMTLQALLERVMLETALIEEEDYGK